MNQSTLQPEYGIIDTSVYLELADLDPAQLPQYSLVTTITVAEVVVGPVLAHDDLERVRRQREAQQVIADFDPLPFDTEAALAYPTVVASLRSLHRKPVSRSNDALIAAIALSMGLPLYTKNVADFSGIEGLEVREVTS
ncbi:MAG: type II toxin-antitoxin system VapC family toxin [Corynebacterium sp.]|nr:type II toxin-antitoxin system VapC family toxin [Corynebacterium sp.]